MRLPSLSDNNQFVNKMGKIMKVSSKKYLGVMALLLSISLISFIVPLFAKLDVQEIKVVFVIRIFTLVIFTLMAIVPLILFSIKKPKSK